MNQILDDIKFAVLLFFLKAKIKLRIFWQEKLAPAIGEVVYYALCFLCDHAAVVGALILGVILGLAL